VLGIVIAQAVGRWGNYFNQELFGGHTSLPWALHVTNAEGAHAAGYYQPTFLYESTGFPSASFSPRSRTCCCAAATGKPSS
jgi:prolipoprotein diacylglyceryltransferase